MIDYIIDEYGRPLMAGVSLAPPSGPIIPPLPEIYGRSGRWPKFLKDFLEQNRTCAGCGRKSETGHHIKPFHNYPELELVESNIVAVCIPCHFVLCHAGDWKLSVEFVKKRLSRNLKEMSLIKIFNTENGNNV